jgi:uncharacterized membrane protein
MATPNEELLESTRIMLRGKWGQVIITFLIYIVIVEILGNIPEVGQAITLVLGGPMALGAAIYSLSIARGGEPRSEEIFHGFRFFSKALIAELLVVILILLWGLLLIIPGIIAALSYSMTFYILADDQSLDAMQAIDLSKKMMNGYKMKYFTLSLRYVLLSLLCLLTLGIGFLWLIPYINIVNARFYDDIKGPVVMEHSFS